MRPSTPVKEGHAKKIASKEVRPELTQFHTSFGMRGSPAGLLKDF
jgi:hypothetical protein